MCSDSSNEKLIQRAHYGGLTLTGFAVLLSLLMPLSGIAIVRNIPNSVWVLIPFAAIIASNWLLAAAARRGDATALTIVIVFLGIQTVLSSGLMLTAYIRTGDIGGPLNFIWNVIPFLFAVCLTFYRFDLIRLRQRGLLESVFPRDHSSRTYCLAGGVLLLLGGLILYGGLALILFRGVQVAGIRREFMQFLDKDEPEIRAMLDKWQRSPQPEQLNVVIERIDQLEDHAHSLAQRATSPSDLKRVISDYADAVHKWRDAVVAMREEGASSQRALKELDEGNAIRVRALNEFDTIFSGPSNQ